MKRPAGRSIAWAVGGCMLGMTGMAITYPTPTTNQPIFGVVKPAPVTEYVDKPVYRVPYSCQQILPQVHEYESALGILSGEFGSLRDLVDQMRMAIRAKDANGLADLMKKWDATEEKLYNEEDDQSNPTAHTRMYRAMAEMEMLDKRCTHDIKNQSN